MDDTDRPYRISVKGLQGIPDFEETNEEIAREDNTELIILSILTALFAIAGIALLAAWYFKKRQAANAGVASTGHEMIRYNRDRDRVVIPTAGGGGAGAGVGPSGIGPAARSGSPGRRQRSRSKSPPTPSVPPTARTRSKGTGAVARTPSGGVRAKSKSPPKAGGSGMHAGGSGVKAGGSGPKASGSGVRVESPGAGAPKRSPSKDSKKSGGQKTT